MSHIVHISLNWYKTIIRMLGYKFVQWVFCKNVALKVEFYSNFLEFLNITLFSLPGLSFFVPFLLALFRLVETLNCFFVDSHLKLRLHFDAFLHLKFLILIWNLFKNKFRITSSKLTRFVFDSSIFLILKFKKSKFLKYLFENICVNLWLKLKRNLSKNSFFEIFRF